KKPPEGGLLGVSHCPREGGRVARGVKRLWKKPGALSVALPGYFRSTDRYSAGSARRRASARQRIGPQLQLDGLRPVLLAAFEVEVGPRPRRGPERAPFPARALVVDAAVDVLRELARRPRQAQGDELAVDERQDRVRAVAHRDRHVLAEPEHVEVVHPHAVADLRAAGVLHVAQL